MQQQQQQQLQYSFKRLQFVSDDGAISGERDLH